MESLQNKINEAGRLLRIDIQNYFDLKLSQDNKKQGFIDFLSAFEFITQEDKEKIVGDMDSYAL